MPTSMPSSMSSQEEISWILMRCDNLAPAQKERKRPVQNKTKVDVQVFDIVHHKRRILHAFQSISD